MQTPSIELNNKSMKMIIESLEKSTGYDADIALFRCLVNISTALKLAAVSHPLEARDLNERFNSLENMLNECMSSDSMVIYLLLFSFFFYFYFYFYFYFFSTFFTSAQHIKRIYLFIISLVSQ